MSKKDGRDSRGRFQKGCAAGPGRPRRAVEFEYQATLADAVPLDRWKRICEKAAAQAEEGDARAREWLGDHLLGARDLIEVAAQERALITDDDITLRIKELLVEQHQRAEHLPWNVDDICEGTDDDDE